MFSGNLSVHLTEVSAQAAFDGRKWRVRLSGEPARLNLEIRIRVGFFSVPLGIRGVAAGDIGEGLAVRIDEVHWPAGIRGAWGITWVAKWISSKLQAAGLNATASGAEIRLPKTLFENDKLAVDWQNGAGVDSWLTRYQQYAETKAGFDEIRERFPVFVQRFGKMLGNAMDIAVELFRAFQDAGVPPTIKVRVAAGLIYLIMPMDAVPDWLGPAGFQDDIMVLGMIVDQVGTLLQQHHPETKGKTG